MSTAVHAAFFCGDYRACVVAASREAPSADVKCLWFRALVECGCVGEARAIAGVAGDLLDEALLLYADAHALRGVPDDPQWMAVLARAARVQNLSGDRDAAAVVLSIVYCWAGQLEDAYRLASQSATVEG